MTAFSLCPHVTSPLWKKRRSLVCLPLLAKTLVLLYWSPTLLPSFITTSLKSVSPNAVTLDVRASAYEFLGDIIQFIMLSNHCIPIKVSSVRTETWIVFFTKCLICLRPVTGGGIYYALNKCLWSEYKLASFASVTLRLQLRKSVRTGQKDIYFFFIKGGQFSCSHERSLSILLSDLYISLGFQII